MTKKDKKKLKILLAITALIFVTFTVFTIRYANRIEEERQKGTIEKGTAVKKVQKEYDAVYYARTAYENQQFRVLFDSELKDGSHWVRYTLFDDNDVEDMAEKEIYQQDVPVNTIIEEYLSGDEYSKKIDGHELFEASQDVTTIVLVKTVKFENVEPGTFGDAVTYVTDKDSVPVDKQIQQFASEITKENGLGVDAYCMEQEDQELTEYITANKFTLYEKGKSKKGN